MLLKSPILANTIGNSSPHILTQWASSIARATNEKLPFKQCIWHTINWLYLWVEDLYFVHTFIGGAMAKCTHKARSDSKAHRGY